MSLSRLLCMRPVLLALGTTALIATTAQAQSAPPPNASAPPADPSATPGSPPAPRGSIGRDVNAGPLTLEEVTVTARKRNERLLDVPVSANALSGAALDRYAITDIQVVSQQVPQVEISHAASGNGAIITVRGIGSASVDASIEQEVTVNIDGVPISRGRVIQQAFFDQQSLEVLKGPQALYFGKNSPAGVISISSTNPSNQFGGYARLGYETQAHRYYGEGAVNLPFTDTFQGRLAVRLSKMDGGYTKGVAGPITDPRQLPAALSGLYPGSTYQPLPGSPYHWYPGDQEAVGRLSLQYHPNEKFDGLFKWLVSEYEDRGDSMAGRIFSCGPLTTHPASIDLGAIFLTGAPGVLVDPYGSCNIKSKTNSYGTVPPGVAAGYPGSHGGIPFTHVHTNLASLTLNYHPSEQLTLTSVTGFYKYSERQWSNYDETVFAVASGKNNEYNTSWTEELRAATSLEGPLNFTGGLYYGHDKRSFVQQGFVFYAPPDPATGQTNTFGSQDYFGTRTYSAFGELNLKLPYNVEIAGGARYTVEKKSGDTGTIYLHRFAQLINLASPVGKRIQGSFTDHNWSPQVTVSWHPAKDILVYGAYKEGFKSGGFSAPAVIPANATPENQKFNQETAKGGEIGIKGSNFLPGLTGDLTVYHYTHYGLQLTAFDAATTSYFTQNAASATIKGIEVNLNYVPPVYREISFRLSFGYNKARYDKFTDSQCWTGQPTATLVNGKPVVSPTPATNAVLVPYSHGRYCIGGVQDLTGQPLSRAPDWSGTFGVSWDHPLTDTWTLGLTADTKYTDGYYLSTNNNPFAFQHSYQLLNLSARLYSKDWELAIIGRNVTDKAYATLGGDKPLGLPGEVLSAVGEPRTVAVQLTRQF
jgi:outer membrane receptor protein involved in Fe transport